MTRNELLAVGALAAAGGAAWLLSRSDHPGVASTTPGVVTGTITCLTADGSAAASCPEVLDITLVDAGGLGTPAVIDLTGLHPSYSVVVAPGVYDLEGAGAVVRRLTVAPGSRTVVCLTVRGA